jgi:hypothetical protein
MYSLPKSLPAQTAAFALIAPHACSRVAAVPLSKRTERQIQIQGLSPRLYAGIQDYARQSKAVAALNNKAPGKPPRFPFPVDSLNAASALLPDTAAATATSRHLLDTQDSPKLRTWPAPPSVLLLTTGSPVGAVADIVDAEWMSSGDGSEPIILTLNVVHKPEIISELQQHPVQTQDSHAHYHFYTPAGVTVDAVKFLKTSAGGLAGVSHAARHCKIMFPLRKRNFVEVDPAHWV